MRSVCRTVLLFSLLLSPCIALGCSDKSTSPDDDNPPPPPPTGLTHRWSKGFGDGQGQAARAVAFDTSGNVIVTGYFGGALDFGGGALTSAGQTDVFVAKLDTAGNHLWSKRFGDGEYQSIRTVAVDVQGNVFVAGYFEGTVDFGGGTLTSAGDGDIFFAKFESDGAHLWSKRFGDVDKQGAFSVAIDGSGDVLLAGYFGGAVDFGGGALTSAGASDIFVARFKSDGSHLWSKRFGDGDYQYAYAVAVDASGNVFVTGQFAGTADFGGDPLTSTGDADIFIAKFGSDGSHLWSKNFGDGSYQGAYTLALDAVGNVTIAGSFQGAVDFGGGTLTSAGWEDIFVAAFGPDGAHVWSKSFGDGGDQSAEAVAVDASGNAIVTGYFYGAVDFGGGALASSGGWDIFVAAFGPDGAHLWSKRFGNANHQAADAVGIHASGSVILAGYFSGFVDFGGGAVTSAGGDDVFVAKFAL